jgi:hypothetical protein
MKNAVIFSLAVLALGIAAAITDTANAVVYCQYIDYPANCVVRPGVRLVPRPAVSTVGVAARGVAVRPGTPANRGGPVNRAGRR